MYMRKSRGEPSIRQHRLAYQTAAFLTVMIVPVFLYWAAQAEANAWILVLLGVMTAGMTLALWIS